MNLEPDPVFGRISKGTLAVMDNEFKYVIHLDNQQESLYRYKADRGDEHNLIADEPATAQRLHNILFARLKEVNERSAIKP